MDNNDSFVISSSLSAPYLHLLIVTVLVLIESQLFICADSIMTISTTSYFSPGRSIHVCDGPELDGRVVMACPESNTPHSGEAHVTFSPAIGETSSPASSQIDRSPRDDRISDAGHAVAA